MNKTMMRTKELMESIIGTKVAELKQEIFKQICAMPLRNRLLFAVKVILKKI